MIVVGAIGFYGSTVIPDTVLEPVGAAPVPRWISISIIVMALAMLILALRPSPPVRTAQPQYRSRPELAIAAVGLLGLYILSMQIGLVGFRVATGLYILAFGLLMSGLRWRAASMNAAVAIAVALGGYTLFTRFLFIDLPQ